MKPLAATGFVFCEACGAVSAHQGKCRGHREARMGSKVLAMRQLLHDWRNDRKGFEKYHG